jgi:hypothetical protein
MVLQRANGLRDGRTTDNGGLPGLHGIADDRCREHGRFTGEEYTIQNSAACRGVETTAYAKALVKLEEKSPDTNYWNSAGTFVVNINGVRTYTLSPTRRIAKRTLNRHKQKYLAATHTALVAR